MSQENSEARKNADGVRHRVTHTRVTTGHEALMPFTQRTVPDSDQDQYTHWNGGAPSVPRPAKRQTQHEVTRTMDYLVRTQGNREAAQVTLTQEKEDPPPKGRLVPSQ